MKSACFWVLAAAALIVACGDDVSIEAPGGPGPTKILLTDSPFPFDQVRSVEVFIVSVAAAPGLDTSVASAPVWTTVAEPRQVFDLLELQGGTTTIVGEGVLPVGDYGAVRMVMNGDLSRVVMADGSEAVVDWQRNGEIVLEALVEDPLTVPVEGAQIVIDFDVGRSFLPVGDGFVFIPWIRAVNRAATGRITGTVRGRDGPGHPVVPVPSASVTVFRGSSLAALSATARTDEAGRFIVPFLVEGSYTIQADPPMGLDAGKVVEHGVHVGVGSETAVELTLPEAGATATPTIRIEGRSSIVVGESVPFVVFLTNEDGDSVATPLIEWLTSDPAIADISGGGQSVMVTGKAPGLALILATGLGVTDSVLVTVGQTGTAVETVDLTPATQTINAGDSTSVRATLRDAAGNILGGRSITWTVSDAHVVSHSVSLSGDLVVLTAIAPGTATITATSEGNTGSATVTVR